MLHLLGYDHAEPEEEREMFALQNQLLQDWYEQQAQLYRDSRLLDKSRNFDE